MPPSRRSAPAGFPRLSAGVAVLLGSAALLAVHDAGAVFVFTSLATARQVTLRVGSANSAVNTVTFDVQGASVSPTPSPVTGVPGNGTPASTPANGTEIEVVTRMPATLFGTDTLTLSVDSTAGLSCVGGSGCGTTIVPFTAVSWTSYNLAPGGQDIQSGTFTGAANQPLASYTQSTSIFGGASVTLRNVLVFRYDNTTLYPAGRYTGRVVYTATNL